MEKKSLEVYVFKGTFSGRKEWIFVGCFGKGREVFHHGSKKIFTKYLLNKSDGGEIQTIFDQIPKEPVLSSHGAEVEVRNLTQNEIVTFLESLDLHSALVSEKKSALTKSLKHRR